MNGLFGSVIAPMLIGATAISLMSITRRSVMNESANAHSIHPLDFLILEYAFATLFFGIIYTLFWGFEYPAMSSGLWNAIIGGVVANVFIQFFNTKAAQMGMGEVSLTAPLQAMTPGLITFLAFVLGEYPSKIGWAGVVCMSLGSYIIVWDKKPEHWWEYLGPLKRIILLFKLKKMSGIERSKTLAVSFAFASAIIGTVGILFEGLYGRRSLTMQSLIMASMALVAILSFAYFGIRVLCTDLSGSREIFKLSVLPKMGAMGLLWVAHVLMIVPIYSKTFVSYTGTLKRLHVLISVILASVIFREMNFAKRLAAAIIIVIGACLLASDDLPARITSKLEGIGF